MTFSFENPSHGITLVQYFFPIKYTIHSLERAFSFLKLSIHESKYVCQETFQVKCIFMLLAHFKQ